MEYQERLQYITRSYKTLAFKYPSTFNENITHSIVSMFEKDGMQHSYNLIELQEYYNEFKNPKIKNNEYSHFKDLLTIAKESKPSLEDIYEKVKEQDIMLLKENLNILSSEKIICSYNVLYKEQDSLYELEKYCLYMSKEQILYEAKKESEKSIINYVIEKMQNSSYPYRQLASTQDILRNLKRSYFEINTLVYSLISSSKLILIPLVSNFDSKYDRHAEYLIAGKESTDAVRMFLSTSLIPSLKEIYIKFKDANKLTTLEVRESEISIENRYKVFKFCFFIINVREKTPILISLDEYNVAHLVLDSWLTIEADPIAILNTFPEIDIDNNFISPFLSRYLQDFPVLTKHLKLMKRFMSVLSQLIEREELIEFFISQGVRRKIAESFLMRLPSTIMSFRLFQYEYVIAKGQIVNSIFSLYNGNYHKNTRIGRFQFEILARMFRYLEHSTKNLSLFLKDINITPEKYKEVVFALAHDSYTYNREEKDVDRELRELSFRIEKDKGSGKYKASYSLPSKIIYTPEDFRAFSKSERKSLFKELSLVTIECLGVNNNFYELYIKKSNLTATDIAFLQTKPTYELIYKHFNAS